MKDIPPGSIHNDKSQIRNPKLKKLKKVIFLVGPTAVGKTEIAMKLAHRLDAEIISCDSMQVYKKMDIINSKPSSVLRKRIRHHLIDTISPEQEFNVADYKKQATLKIKDILKRGRKPLLVGGTGFYMSVLLDGIFNEDIKNRKIRNRLYNQAERHGREKLYERLKRVDPEAALKIHPHDLRRIARALEVYENTGIPISELQNRRKGIAADFEVKIFCLNKDRDQLYRAIDRRVDNMFKRGLLKEARDLLALKLSKTASQAIGIREMRGYLEGKYDLGEAKRLIKRNSRRYAKRQLTWFRKDKRIVWINIDDNEKPKDVTERIWKKLS